MNKRKSLGSSNRNTSTKRLKKQKKSLFLNTDDFRNKAPSDVGVASTLQSLAVTPHPLESLDKESTPLITPKLNIQRRRSRHLTYSKENDPSKRRENGKGENIPCSGKLKNVEQHHSRDVAKKLEDISQDTIGMSLNSEIDELDLLTSETLTSIENKSYDNVSTSNIKTTKTSNSRKTTRKTANISTTSKNISNGNKHNPNTRDNGHSKTSSKNHTPQKPFKANDGYLATPLLPDDALEDNIRDDSLLNCLNSPISISSGKKVEIHCEEISSSLLGQASKDDSIFANLELTQMVSDIDAQAKTSNKVLPQAETFYGLPLHVKPMFSRLRGITKLYDWQDECLHLPALDDRQNLVYSLPTSGGKTLVAEILMLKEILVQKKNVVLVLPYVSIVQEKVRGLSPFAVELNFHIEEYAASKGSIPPKKRRKKSLYIATIEKANAIVNSFIEEDRCEELGMVVVDELHMIGEGGGRGALLEILLTKVMFKSSGTQIIGMSATLGNMKEIIAFLNAEVYNNNFRPVDLTEYVKVDDAIYKINPKPQNDDDLLSFHRKVTYPEGLNPSLATRDPDQLISLVMEVIPQHSCLVFCPTKKNCESVGVMIAKSLPEEMRTVKEQERATLLQVIQKSTNGVCQVLAETIPFGIAYHHSGLTLDERELIEEAYSSGVVSLLCCTSTLAAGVNLPARRVILRSPYVGNKFLSRSQYKQMVGRAGRAGIDTSGESIVILQQKDKLKSRVLFDGPVTNCLSSLFYEKGKGLRELILSLLGLKICSSEAEIVEFLHLTLFHIQQRQSNDKYEELQYIKKEVEQLLELELVKNISKDGVQLLRTTNLGNATLKSCMNLQLAQFVYKELLRGLEAVVLANELHLLYLVTPLDQVSLVRIDWMVFYELVDKLGDMELKACELIGISQDILCRKATGQRIPKSANFQEFIYKRFYLTLVARAILRSRTLWDVADMFNESRGFLQNLYSSLMSFLANMVHFCEEMSELWTFKLLFQALSTQISTTMNADVVALMEIPGVKQGRAMQLFRAGYKSLQHVAHAEVRTLSREIDNLSRKQAELIVCSAKMILKEKIEALKEEADEIAAVPGEVIT